MQILSTILLSLSWVHLALAEPGDLIPGLNLTGILEVDLLFPRNETYARLPFTPIVFAFRNAGPEWYIQPTIKVNLWSSKENRTVGIPELWIDIKQNLDHVDPFFSYWALEELNVEDHWVLTWTLGWHSCSLAAPVDGQPGLFKETLSTLTGGRVEFTTKNATKQLDLVAALQEDTCPGSGLPTSRASLNVTSYVKTPSIGLPNGGPCAIVANATATEAPCGVVHIDKAAAKSITAQLKATKAAMGAAPGSAVGSAALAGSVAAVLSGMALFLVSF